MKKQITATSLLNLMQSGKYREIVDYMQANKGALFGNHMLSKLYAAALFMIEDYHECCSICSTINHVYTLDPEFVSLYGASLRRIGEFDQALSVFEPLIKDDCQDPRVLNNYSNLLIDMGKFDEAEGILQALSETDPPNIQDVISNLTRLNTERSLRKTNPSNNALGQLDPMLLAFSEDEVFTRDMPTTESVQIEKEQSLHPLSALPNISETHDSLMELLEVARAILSDSPDSALNDCNIAAGSFKPIHLPYEVAAEAYLRKGNFYAAELCFSTALASGATDASVYHNLANLSMMRGDYLLSSHYINSLSSVYPSHPFLDTLRESLQEKSTICPRPSKIFPVDFNDSSYNRT